MKFSSAAVLVAVGFTSAVPTNNAMSTATTANALRTDAKISPILEKRGSSRFSCGQYKFDDGTVQEFYSQVWAGYPADEMICRLFKYEFRDKKGQEGKMVAAKVDKGCTCFFYATPCDPRKGYAELWEGWEGWENYAATDKTFKGWYCLEQN